MTKPYKTIRAVVEVRVPQHVTEKSLVWKLKDILKWPIQMGRGEEDIRVRPLVKEYGKVRSYERRFEPRGFRRFLREIGW